MSDNTQVPHIGYKKILSAIIIKTSKTQNQA